MEFLGPDPDDEMDDGHTDGSGFLRLSGEERELTSIDPRLEIYHDCLDIEQKTGIPKVAPPSSPCPDLLWRGDVGASRASGSGRSSSPNRPTSTAAPSTSAPSTWRCASRTRTATASTDLPTDVHYACVSVQCDAF